MILPILTELQMLGVFERGVPNAERIVMKALVDISLAQYGVLLAHRKGNTLESPSTPINDQLLWMTDRQVKAGTTIFVYTGPGEFKVTNVNGTTNPAVVVHWNKSTTIFANPFIVPVVFRIGAIYSFPVPENRPQQPLLTPPKRTN